MNSAVFASLTCLLVLYAQGHPSNISSKCKCSNGYVGRINRQLIKAEPVIHHPSVFCPHTEIIITTTANKEKCVNPESPLGKLILSNRNKHRRSSRAVSTTTASSRRDAVSSTRLHTTAKAAGLKITQRG